MNVEPVFALVLAWLLLGQAIAPMQVVGALLVVGAVMALGLRNTHKPAGPPTKTEELKRTVANNG
jgi:drug/metabolite transporter (DMT)-like permease